MTSKGRTGRTRKPHDGQGVRGLTHSPAATWIGLTVGLIAIGSTAIQWVWGYADLNARTNRNMEEIARNFREDEFRTERQIKSIERLDTQIGGLTQVYVKIGQMETQLGNITELLKDLKVQIRHQSDKVVPGK